MLGEGVPDGVRAMFRLEHHDVVVPAGNPVAGPELEDLDGELVALDAEVDREIENAGGAPGAVQSHGCRAVLQPHGAEEPGDAQHVIGVIVSKEDLGKGEPDAVPHHLSLGALATVEEDHLPFPSHGERRHVPVDRGDRRAGTEEGDA